MAHRWLITRGKLDRSIARVRRELVRHGFWQEQMAAVSTQLVWLATAHGYYLGRRAGTIVIPAVSASRLWEILCGQYQGICDVVRHEHGHALCRSFPELFRTRRFSSVFGARLPSLRAYEYDPELHVSLYAATDSEEWFCETFMYYLKHSGRLPRQWRHTPIASQWQLIRDLSRAVGASGK